MMKGNIGTLMPRVAAEIDKRSNQILRERLGLGLSQFKIMLTLLSGDGISQSEIAEKLSQTEAAISRQIKLLEQKGLIKIKKSAASGREKSIFLSQKGLDLTDMSISILNDFHSPMFATLSEEQQNQLTSILLTMREYLRQNNV